MALSCLSMLPKNNRLKKKRDFEKVLKRGKGFREDFLFLKVAKNNLEINRFAFVVSLKVSKKASLRNRIRRRLQEIFRAKLPEIKVGFDGVLIVARGLEARSFPEMEKTINKLLKKAKLI